MTQPPSSHPAHQSPQRVIFQQPQQPQQSQLPTPQQPTVTSVPYPHPAAPYTPPAHSSPVYAPAPTYPTYTYPAYPQVPYQQFPVTYPNSTQHNVPVPTPQTPYSQTPHPTYPYPTYSQPPYTSTAYPPSLHPVPYPQTILPPPKVPKPERENEIYWRGYKESADYPLGQARKERRIARIVFFSVIALLFAFFFSPLLDLLLPEKISVLQSILITFSFEIVLIVIFSLILRRAFPQGLRESLGLKKPRGAHILIGVGSAFGALTVAIIGALIAIVLGADITENPKAEGYMNLPDWQLVIVLLICVPLGAPLFEELLFRGILVGSAVRAFPGKAGFFVAIIVTGLIFGSLHFSGTFDILGVYSVILISCVGMLLAWLRLRFNSAIVTMTTHAVYNGSLSVFALIGSVASGVAALPLS